MLKLALALACLLSPQVGSANKGKDGFFFTGAEWHVPEFRVRLVEYDSNEELARTALARGAKVRTHNGVPAWARIVINKRDDGSVDLFCEVHIISQARRYRPEQLGHEITHCAKGRWHREPEA
jgi:hypothetical protein